MYVHRYDEIDSLDSFHPPTVFDREGAKFKEWHHYIFHDKKSRLFGLVNFSILGNPYEPDNAYASVISIVVDENNKWDGIFETFPTTDLEFSRLRPEIAIGKSKVFYNNGSYFVHIENDEMKQIVCNLKFDAISSPVTSTGLQLGVLAGIWSGWMGIPRLSVSGTITSLRNKTRRVLGMGYHDHNWGKMEWGDRVQWDAGIVMDDISYDGNNNLILSFMVDRSGAMDKFNSAALFVRRKSSVERIFTDTQLKIEELGEFSGKVEKFPSIEIINRPDFTFKIPGRFKISGIQADESASIEFRPKKCCQIITTSGNMESITLWNEMFGEGIISAQLNGKKVKSRKASCYLESVRSV